jgi:hypothetical protein
MKLVNCSRWIIVLIILLVAVTVLLTQVDSVQATFTNMHAATVLLRVETEIMQKTPAGQYYESLFWKHNDELMQIASQHPENNEDFWRVTRLFVPGLDALLNGEGDTIQITFEQVESLKAELDWLASMGSAGLREDLQKEQQRLPLDAFVGMTMNEALDFINLDWAPDSLVEKTLVPDSEGNWAYYVHQDVYLEYPGNYALQVSGSETDYIYFMPLQGLPEQWNPCVMKVRIWNVPTTDMSASDPGTWFSHESVVWESSVRNTEFPGVEFISNRGDPSRIDLHAFLYNQEKRLAVDVRVLIMESQQFSEDYDYAAMVNEQYEYFQHLIDRIRLDPSSGSELPVQQTATPDLSLQLTPTPYIVVDQTLTPVQTP